MNDDVNGPDDGEGDDAGDEPALGGAPTGGELAPSAPLPTAPRIEPVRDEAGASRPSEPSERAGHDAPADAGPAGTPERSDP